MTFPSSPSPSLIPIADVLRGVSLLGLDTSPVVYYVEKNPAYFPICQKVFEAVAEGSLQAVAGTLTLTETLVKPLRTGDAKLADAYRNLLITTVGMALQPITVPIAGKAAELRALYNLSMADALQMACALAVGCDAFLTNDKKLRRVVELRVLVLDELTP